MGSEMCIRDRLYTDKMYKADEIDCEPLYTIEEDGEEDNHRE